MFQARQIIRRSSLIVRNLSGLLTPTTKPVPLCYFTEDEISIRDATARFLKEKVRPLVRKMDEEKRVDPSLIEEMFKNGLFGMSIPEQYGGSGASFMGVVLAAEEFARYGSIGMHFVLQNLMVNGLINHFANPEQKSRYLKLLATKMLGSVCVSEPSSGSDAFAMKTTAEKDGDDFIINGSKIWITNATEADIFIVFARSDPAKGYKGISAFILDKSTPGLSVGPSEKKLGLWASSWCPVYFENVRVRKSAVLGELGHAYRYIAKIFNNTRLCIGATSVGISQACLDQTIAYTLERKQFGSAVFDFQGVQHQIAKMATYLECARLLTHNSVRMLEAGLPVVKESAMAKYYASELVQKITSKCIDLVGAVGFTTSLTLERFYRDAKAATLYEGTSNLQLNTIAKCLKEERGS